MCKLFIATDVSKMNKEDLNSMINIVEEFFYKSEKDGFSITTKSHGEPVDFYKFIDKKNDILIDNINSLILHGRTSTNSVSLINTHPIQVDDIFLSHNGVVQDLNLDYELKTTNDTEYLTYRINQGINAVEKNIRGYYAAAFVRDSNNELVIFRDDIAPLYFVWSEEFESFFYCTSRVLLEKLFLVEASPMPENTLLKYIGNELIESVKFNPGGSSVYADNLAHLSLGNSTEDRFFKFIENELDASYTIFLGSDELKLNEFFRLSDKDKKDCIIVGWNGIIVSANPEFDGGSIFNVSNF